MFNRREVTCCFLDLSPELRNLVYLFVAGDRVLKIKEDKFIQGCVLAWIIERNEPVTAHNLHDVSKVFESEVSALAFYVNIEFSYFPDQSKQLLWMLASRQLTQLFLGVSC
jgi:hypothetical protein